MPVIQSRAASRFSLASSRSDDLFVGVADLFAITMVRLVVDDDDVLHPQEIAAASRSISPSVCSVSGAGPSPCNSARPTLEIFKVSVRRKAW